MGYDCSHADPGMHGGIIYEKEAKELVLFENKLVK